MPLADSSGTDRYYLAAVLQGGSTDMAGPGQALAADPEWVKKLQ